MDWGLGCSNMCLEAVVLQYMNAAHARLNETKLLIEYVVFGDLRPQNE